MKVLFICTGNVCRSPLAEGYLRFLLEQKSMKGIEVLSAGIAALAGSNPFSGAQAVALKYNFDISAKTAQQVTTAMIQDADRVLCMETYQASAVMQRDPHSSNKIGLLGTYHPKHKSLLQIPDPLDFDFEETLITFQTIKDSVEGYMSHVKAN